MKRAFTLIELLVSMTVLSILLLVCASVLDQSRRTWSQARARVDQFREARIAFDILTRNLAQAGLNTYWDYYYKETGTNEGPADNAVPPSAYVRHSELQFQSGTAYQMIGPAASPASYPGHAVFFQAPLGLSVNHPGLGNLLNARGYYVEFDTDETDKPPFIVERGLPLSHRYRLMEYRPPAERTTSAKSPFQGNTIYTKPVDWFRQDLSPASRVVAENILLLIISPRVPDSVASAAKLSPWWIAPRYDYNSLDRDNSTVSVESVRIRADGTTDQGTQHLLPPLLEVTMVAADDGSAARWIERRGGKAVPIQQESGAAFTDPSLYDRDLQRLKDYLTSQKLSHRIFTATIALRNARWDGRAF